MSFRSLLKLAECHQLHAFLFHCQAYQPIAGAAFGIVHVNYANVVAAVDFS